MNAQNSSHSPEPQSTGGVLIVDDNEVDRYLLKRVLRSAGLSLDIYEAENGEQALDFFVALNDSDSPLYGVEPPLAVFLDINMPRKNGLEFLEDFSRYRSVNPHITTSVVMLSTAERHDEQRRAFSYHFVSGYFKKGAIDAKTIAALMQRIADDARYSR